jgi:Enoyl-[acyl-carrier-protein] reductase (NADH)
MTPLQKVTTVKDFADAVTFFALDDARAITGQNLVVDGGLTFN